MQGEYVVQRYYEQTKTWKTVATAPTIEKAQIALCRMTTPSITEAHFKAPKLRIQRKEDVNGK